MAENETKSARGQSTIQFPYKDLESAIATATAMVGSGAVNGVAPDQLAALLGISGGTGNFMTRVATARMFGLIGASTPYQLTELGYEIADKNERRQQQARARAFLIVPLYRKLYETYRGKVLPSRPHGLERAMVDLGVVPTQATNARLAFERSAKQAGFFAAGEDRLVEPLIGAAPERPAQQQVENPVPPAPSLPANPPPPAVHPFVQGLLLSMPKAGEQWPLADRVEWLRAAVHSFNLIYKSDGEITISGTPKATPVFPLAQQPARELASNPPSGPEPVRGAVPVQPRQMPPSLRQAAAASPRRKGEELDDDIPF